MSEQLLHAEILERVPITGNSLVTQLSYRVDECAEAVDGLSDKPVSVLIRSRNNIARLEELFEDIHAQVFDKEVEVVVVDTESTDGSAEFAKSMGATVRNIRQEEFNYPKSLNYGFEAANYEWIFTLVDHSRLSNRQLLRTATRWDGDSEIAGISGVPLPDDNATITERISSMWFAFNKLLNQPAHMTDEAGFGDLGANYSAVRRSAWQEAGGYDENYAAGCEDVALAKTLIQNGHKIVIEPALSIYHSHGLGPINGLRQLLAWRKMAGPMEFDLARIQKYRKDLR